MNSSKLVPIISLDRVGFSDILTTPEKSGDVIVQLWGLSSVGRTFDWQSKGRRFDPGRLHFFIAQ